LSEKGIAALPSVARNDNIRTVQTDSVIARSLSDEAISKLQNFVEAKIFSCFEKELPRTTFSLKGG